VGTDGVSAGGSMGVSGCDGVSGSVVVESEESPDGGSVPSGTLVTVDSVPEATELLTDDVALDTLLEDALELE